FLRTQLGVTGDTGQLLDVDRGVAVFLYHALGNEDGVLEVVAVPGHERDQHVLPQRQLAQGGGRTLGQHVVRRNSVTDLHQRPLVDAGVLVGPGVLDQRIDVDTGVVLADLVLVDLDHDAAGIDLVDDAAAAGDDVDAGVGGDHALDAGADQRRLCAQG